MTSELLKEAIADAKAVRATALANAKAALEEAFTPKLESMLAKKLKEEAEGEVEESSDIGSGDNKVAPISKQAATSDACADAGQKFDAHMEEEAMEEEGVEKDWEAKTPSDEEITSDEIEEILKELEEEAAPVPAPAPVDAAAAPAPVAPAPADAAAAPAPVAPVAEETEEAEKEEEEEEINLDELLTALNEVSEEEEEEGKKLEEEDEEEEEEEGKKVEESLRKENAEYRKTIEFLREQLSEVNLLNAKLLYTNKLFKGNNLSNAQKMKVIEQFDLTNSIREVKLTFANMQEALNLGTAVTKKTAITEGLASKPVNTTKPVDKIVAGETNEMALRFQKLAGIKK